jgi:hypothetical protein
VVDGAAGIGDLRSFMAQRWPPFPRAATAVTSLAAGDLLAGQVSSPLSGEKVQVRFSTGRLDPLPPFSKGGSVLSQSDCRA